MKDRLFLVNSLRPMGWKPAWIVCMFRCRWLVWWGNFGATCISLWGTLASKGFHNKNHSLGPLAHAVIERPDTFTRHLFIPGENGSLHRVACEGGWMSWISTQMVARSNDVLAAGIFNSKIAMLKNADKGRGHTRKCTNTRSFLCFISISAETAHITGLFTVGYIMLRFWQFRHE